ncbi:MAG TPA: DNA alkylation repair protein, partial [Bryobacteraceae bacterium]
MTAKAVIARLQAQANPANVAGMARFGIVPRGAMGVPAPELRRLARECGKNHALARELWNSGVHEALVIATMLEE